MSIMEKNPIDILQEAIGFYEKMIVRLKLREGINKECSEEHLNSMVQQLKGKIKVFQKAVTLLNNEQEVQECDARNDATSTDVGNKNKTSNSEATILSAEEVGAKYGLPTYDPIQWHHIKRAMEEYKNQEVQLLNK